MFNSLLISLCLFFASQKQQVQEISFETLQSNTIHPENDTLYVVNFWATWCRPCVAELPFFETANKEFADKKVKIDLVSLDLVSAKNNVNQFIENKNMQSSVYLLNAGDPNTWINKIDTSWSGGIPATIMYKKGSTVFFREGDFATQHELDSVIQNKIQ